MTKRCAGFSPNGPICQIDETWLVGPLRRKRIARPSGSQAGWLDASPVAVVVSRRWPVPAAVIRATSKFTAESGLSIV